MGRTKGGREEWGLVVVVVGGDDRGVGARRKCMVPKSRV